MERRPEKCPLCGHKITKVVNAITKNFYYRCSNKECYFVLGENYTDAEYYLQGQTLQTGCISCGEKLTVVNGPNGLYSRCFKCDCDMRPMTYNGRTYQKWINAKGKNAREEVKTLINNFNSADSKDTQYDFDAFIASPIKEVFTENSKGKDTVGMKTLEVLMEDINKPMEPKEIGTIIDAKVTSVRTSLLSLKSLGLVKIVGYRENPSGNHTLFYQVDESPLPELKTYTKEDGYNSMIAFLKENTDRYGNILKTMKVLKKGLEDAGEKPILFHSSRGICSGYPIHLMEKIMNKQPIQTSFNFNKVSVHRTMRGHYERNKDKDKVMALLHKNMNKSYTISQIAKEIRADESCTKDIIKELKKYKKIKVVGWNPYEEQRGIVTLKYQVNESPLPKLKTTVDNNLYVTIKQFYRKRLQGKRIASLEKAEKAVAGLPVIPLIINQKAYVGYSVADLKDVFKDCSDTSVSRIAKKQNTDVETAVMLSSSRKKEVSNSSPEKNSFFSSLSSFFKKNIHP